MIIFPTLLPQDFYECGILVWMEERLVEMCAQRIYVNINLSYLPKP